MRTLVLGGNGFGEGAFYSFCTHTSFWSLLCCCYSRWGTFFVSLIFFPFYLSFFTFFTFFFSPVPSEIPDTLYKLKYLQVFRINDCRFVGSFPMSLLLKMQFLREFNVSGCKYMAQNSIKRAMEFALERGMKCGR
jgi:hypothetical protein